MPTSRTDGTALDSSASLHVSAHWRQLCRDIVGHAKTSPRALSLSSYHIIANWFVTISLLKKSIILQKENIWYIVFERMPQHADGYQSILEATSSVSLNSPQICFRSYDHCYRNVKYMIITLGCITTSHVKSPVVSWCK